MAKVSKKSIPETEDIVEDYCDCNAPLLTEEEQRDKICRNCR